MTTPVQHCIITGAYLPIIKRRVNLCSTYIQFQDNYPSEYKRFGIGRDEMMILMPQVMGVDVLSGLDKLKYVGEDEGTKDVAKGLSSEMMEMETKSKMLKESVEEMNEGYETKNKPLDRITEVEDEGMNSIAREGMNSIAREGDAEARREAQPHDMCTKAHERMRTEAHFSGSDSREYSDDYYDYDVDIDEDYDTDEEFTDDYDD